MKTQPPLTETIKHNSLGVFRLLRSTFRRIIMNSLKLVFEGFKALKDIFFPKLKLNIKNPKLFKRLKTKMDESCKNFIKRMK